MSLGQQPENVNLLYKRAEVYFLLKDYKFSMRDFMSIVEKDPKHAQVDHGQPRFTNYN